MAEIIFLTYSLYSIVNKVCIDEARFACREKQSEIEFRRFNSKFSWFFQLHERIRSQEFNYRFRPNVVLNEVDDLIVTLNPHSTQEEEDNDPNWYCLRKLKNSLNEQLLSPLTREKHNLLEWVKQTVENLTEEPPTYLVRGNHNLRLDNLDITYLSKVVDLCKEDEEVVRERQREAERQRRIELLNTRMAEDI